MYYFSLECVLHTSENTEPKLDFTKLHFKSQSQNPQITQLYSKCTKTTEH